MCDIPLDLERRFERRWAARFSGPAKQHRLEGQQQHQRVNTPDKSKRKTRRREPAGSVTADLSPRPSLAVTAEAALRERPSARGCAF
jgi:hypothetical protein